MNLRLRVSVCQLLGLMSALSGKSFQSVPGYGRNLVIKAIPGVEDYQSDVYEVFMEPYLYDFGVGYPTALDRSEKQIELAGRRREPGLRAVVHLRADGASGVEGDLVFSQLAPNGPVRVEGNVTGLAAGLHGLHVHHAGDVKDGCGDIGPHFVAHYGRHGGPRDAVRHVGDLGNIKAEEGAAVRVRIVDHLISLSGPRSVVGRAVAVSSNEDDYGRAGTDDSAADGSAGPALACGVVGYLD